MKPSTCTFDIILFKEKHILLTETKDVSVIYSLYIVATSASHKKKRKKISVNLSIHSSWLFGDVNGPQFDEQGFKLVKWAVLSTQVYIYV